MIKKLSMFFISLILIQSTFSQELKEMEIERIPESESSHYIVRNPNEAILIVHSTISNLQFETIRDRINVDKPDPGEYILHLPPGTNLITIKADGYLPVKERFYIEKKKYEEVRIKPKKQAVIQEQVVIQEQAVIQKLKEMVIEEVPESESSPYFVINPNEAVLTVHSTIPGVQFESNQVIKVDNSNPGQYKVHLHPGTNNITFKAEGYSPINGQYYIDKKEYKEIKILSKEQIILKNQELRLQKKNHWKRLKYISLASSVVTAGTSAILFAQAKDNYKKYQNANTVGKVQDYRKVTESMYFMSQITFSISISSFFGSIYSYLKEKKYDKMD